jgi:hypothetical protein
MNLRTRLRTRRDDSGYVMALTALLLVPLLLLTAFAVDLGSWYGQAAKMQRTADAAALAGVIYADDTVANQWDTIARGVAQRNGYVNGVNGVTVSVTRLDDQKIVVGIGKNGSQFFSKLVLGSVPMTRRATAEFVLPIPLGSPLNTFGNQDLAATSPNFWAAISAPYTARGNGDLYATQCINSNSETSCQSANPLYRSSGYLYAIQVPAGGVTGLKLDLFDAGFYDRGLQVETGDANYNSGQTAGVTTRFEFYDQDGTPLIPDDNPPAVCTTGTNGLTILPGANAATYKNLWATLCSKTGTVPAGVYYLRVKSSGISGVTDKGNATNQFALRVTNGLGAVGGLRIYAVNDMSIYSKQASGNTDFYLAEVPAIHAGKKLKVDLFDPGDVGSSSANVTMTIMPPGGGNIVCTYTVDGTGGGTLSPGCSIQTTTSGTATYNGKSLEFTINLPTTYNCNPSNATDCWWKIRANYSAQATDRTVWSAQIVGDPVHLVQ